MATFTLIVVCLVVLSHVHGATVHRSHSSDISTTTEAVTASTVKPTDPPGRIFGDLIRITNEGNKKYDTVSYSQSEDSKTSQTTYPEAKIIVLDNGRTYEVGQQTFQSSSPFLNTAIGAVSAQILSQAHEDYIPYPPNGNPSGYPPYRQEYLGESPLAEAYERANMAGYGPYPTPYQNYNRYQPSCFPNYYNGEEERAAYESFPGRRRKEPIKRHSVTSFG